MAVDRLSARGALPGVEERALDDGRTGLREPHDVLVDEVQTDRVTPSLGGKRDLRDDLDRLARRHSPRKRRPEEPVADDQLPPLDRPALVRATGYLGGKRSDQILPPTMGREASIYPQGGVDEQTARAFRGAAEFVGDLHQVLHEVFGSLVACLRILGDHAVEDGRHVVIRPLAYVAERDIDRYARGRAFPIIPCKLCGSQENMQRVAIKKMLADWERAFPGRTASIFSALRNVDLAHLADVRQFDFRGLDAQRASVVTETAMTETAMTEAQEIALEEQFISSTATA